MQILTGASPSDNYGWYQGQFFDQVEKVYAQKGSGFLKEVRAAFLQARSGLHLETRRPCADWTRSAPALQRGRIPWKCDYAR